MTDLHPVQGGRYNLSCLMSRKPVISFPHVCYNAQTSSFTLQVPEITDYTMEGRTYRYYNGDPLYPFGYGLSYTQFMYSGLSVSPTSVKKGENVLVTVTVENKGMFDADEVILIRVRNLKFAIYLKFATRGNTNKVNELW